MSGDKKVMDDMNKSFFKQNYNTEDVTLPDGNVITIREANGDDEDILSSTSYNKDGTAYYRYLANLIVEPRMTWEGVAAMKNRCIYYGLYKARLLSLGDEIMFDYTFQTPKIGMAPFEENLSKFDRDLSKPYTELEEDKMDKEVIKAYPAGAAETFEFILASGKKLRMRYLTGEMERSTLDGDTEQLSINDKVKLRSLELYTGETWTAIENLSLFTSREMNEIRKALSKNDEQFTCITQVTKSGVTEELSMFLLPAFFFPQA